MDAPQPVSVSPAPVVPYRVGGSLLLGLWLLAAVLGTALATVPGWFGHPLSPPLEEPIAAALNYLVLLALLMGPIHRSGSSIRSMVGRVAHPSAVGWAAGVAVALVGIASICVPVVFIPLSYVAPDFVQFWFIDRPGPQFLMEGNFYRIANLILLLVLCLLGPFVEELTFRGLLLPAWASRSGRRWALFWSSVCFAVLHRDLGGAFVFGFVTGLVFLRTNGLALPILIHASYNTIVSVIAAVAMVYETNTPATLADLRDTWWLALVGLPGIPAIVVLMRRIPGASAVRGA
jgi:membrane protease YdiL (CAAX protease family)